MTQPPVVIMTHPSMGEYMVDSLPRRPALLHAQFCVWTQVHLAPLYFLVREASVRLAPYNLVVRVQFEGGQVHDPHVIAKEREDG